jgi:hypothetical protein
MVGGEPAKLITHQVDVLAQSVKQIAEGQWNIERTRPFVDTIEMATYCWWQAGS